MKVHVSYKNGQSAFFLHFSTPGSGSGIRIPNSDPQNHWMWIWDPDQESGSTKSLNVDLGSGFRIQIHKIIESGSGSVSTTLHINRLCFYFSKLQYITVFSIPVHIRFRILFQKPKYIKLSLQQSYLYFQKYIPLEKLCSFF
jgi:hypothetical protein